MVTLSAFGWGIVGFNPLFVGEVSSSTPAPLPPAPPSKFQSPLRRGSVFILEEVSEKFRGGSFNPLFVGEVSSSPRMEAHTKFQALVSIPSSSGKCLHRSLPGDVQYPKPAFQSPLRRGSVFIFKDFYQQGLIPRFQSPLRRGSVFIRKRVPRAGGIRRVSIPSSSGKCLHR